MTPRPSHRLLAALVSGAPIPLPATADAVAKGSTNGNVTLKVFKPKHSGRHTISYKLHGLKGRSIVSARLPARKGSKPVTKPVKLAPKKKMHKAVVNESASGVIRLGSGSLPPAHQSAGPPPPAPLTPPAAA